MWKLKAKMACERTEMMKLRERERKKEGQSQTGTEPELKVRGAALLLVVCNDFGFRLRCY